jgi:hypothetical protein
MLCCPNGRHVGADYTQFSRRDDETAKNRANAVGRRDDFRPIQAAFRLTAKAACDYTE